MRPAPYVNPIGHIDQITQDGSHFTISQPGGLRRPDRRRPGGGAVLLQGDRHDLKVQGTVTAVDQAGAKSAVTGPWANQEDLRREGTPVYLEPAD